MTGRDFIVYILQNKLEDEEIFKDGKPIGHLTVMEAAQKLEVGAATIEIWFKLNLIPGIKLGNEIFIPSNVII